MSGVTTYDPRVFNLSGDLIMTLHPGFRWHLATSTAWHLADDHEWYLDPVHAPRIVTPLGYRIICQLRCVVLRDVGGETWATWRPHAGDRDTLARAVWLAWSRQKHPTNPHQPEGWYGVAADPIARTRWGRAAREAYEDAVRRLTEPRSPRQTDTPATDRNDSRCSEIEHPADPEDQ